MSGVLELKALECAITDVCPLYDSNVWGSEVAIALDFYPLFLTLGIYIVSLYKYELYFAIVSVILTMNWGINTFLQRVVFGESARFIGCGSAYQMPSFSSQHIVLFEVLMTLYMITWGRRVFVKLTILLRLFSFAVLTARIFIGINTPQQLFMGALAGFVEGLIFHMIILYIAFPYFGDVLNLTLIRWMGLEDNLCRGTNIKDMNDPSTKKIESTALRLANRIDQMDESGRTKYMIFTTPDNRNIQLRVD